MQEQNKGKKIFKTLSLVVGLLLIVFVGYIMINKTTDPIKNYPFKIEVTNSNNVVQKIDNFIDTRKSVIVKSLNKFEMLVNELSKQGYVDDINLYDYGYILYLENHKQYSTDKIVKNFIKNSPYGVYVTKNDKEYLNKKIDDLENIIKQKITFLKRKYKNGIKTSKNNYKIYKLIKYFTYAKVSKEFLNNRLTQDDIDEAMLCLKYKTLNITKTSYGSEFKALPDFWESIKNKTVYSDGIANYYLMIFNFSKNKYYYRLKYKSLVLDILKQLISAWRYGYIYTDLEELGINDYIGKNSIFLQIDKMITQSFINIKNQKPTPNNFLPFNEYINYISKKEIKVKEKSNSLYQFTYNTINKKSSNKIKFKIKQQYKDIMLTHKIEYNKYGDTLTTYYQVKYKEYTTGKWSMYVNRKKQFKTYEEAKKFIKNTLNGIKK